MSSTNYETSINASAFGEINKLSSVYIPRVFANLSTEFVAQTFEGLNLGVVDRVEAVPRPGDKKTYMAFVYFSLWNTENKAAVNLAKRINCPTPGETQARIVYDDPWFWILLPNKSEKKSESVEESDADIPSKEQLNVDEKIDILTDMVEDLQERLLESEKRAQRLEKELCDVRIILLTGKHSVNFPWEFYDTQPMSASVTEDIDYPPHPPKLVRQNAIAIPIPPIPGPITRQTQVSIDWCPHCCEDDCQCLQRSETMAATYVYESAEERKREQEIANYRQDRHQRRMEEACIQQVRVDGMGLVYHNNDSDFWCDP